MASSEDAMLTTLLNARAVKFSHVVRFENGKTNLRNGDHITVTEVLGTADTFVPGNVYLIKGIYTLASHERASLEAHTTLRNPPYTTSSNANVQGTDVSKGSGTFSVMLPMWRDGWPHVSFYPAGGGEGFGGVYFGTGDSVYRERGANASTGSTDNNVALEYLLNRGFRYAVPRESADVAQTYELNTSQATPGVLAVAYHGKITRYRIGDPTKAVRFELGRTQFSSDDKITITEVRGTSDKITPGNIYCVKGTYTLASNNQGTISAFTSATREEDAYGRTMSAQSASVSRGSGKFTVYLLMQCDGYPHVCLYGGKADVYFGTGDTVWKK